MRQADQLAVAGHGRVHAGPGAPSGRPLAGRAAFTARAREVEGRAVERAVTRFWGTVGDEREQVAVFGREGVGIEHGGLGPLRAAIYFAQGRLKRSLPALRAEPLSAAAALLGEAPVRAFAPGPFESRLGERPRRAARGGDGRGGPAAGRGAGQCACRRGRGRGREASARRSPGHGAPTPAAAAARLAASFRRARRRPVRPADRPRSPAGGTRRHGDARRARAGRRARSGHHVTWRARRMPARLWPKSWLSDGSYLTLIDAGRLAMVADPAHVARRRVPLPDMTRPARFGSSVPPVAPGPVAAKSPVKSRSKPPSKPPEPAARPSAPPAAPPIAQRPSFRPGAPGSFLAGPPASASARPRLRRGRQGGAPVPRRGRGHGHRGARNWRDARQVLHPADPRQRDEGHGAHERRDPGGPPLRDERQGSHQHPVDHAGAGSRGRRAALEPALPRLHRDDQERLARSRSRRSCAT